MIKPTTWQGQVYIMHTDVLIWDYNSGKAKAKD